MSLSTNTYFINSPYNGSIDVTATNTFHTGYLDLISLQAILSFSPWTIRVQHICFDLVQLAFLVWSSALARLSPTSLASDRRPIQSLKKRGQGRSLRRAGHNLAFPPLPGSAQLIRTELREKACLFFEGYLRHRRICEQFHPWLLRDDRNRTC